MSTSRPDSFLHNSLPRSSSFAGTEHTSQMVTAQAWTVTDKTIVFNSSRDCCSAAQPLCHDVLCIYCDTSKVPSKENMHISVGDWVLVTYNGDGQLYPGEVT